MQPRIYFNPTPTSLTSCIGYAIKVDQVLLAAVLRRRWDDNYRTTPVACKECAFWYSVLTQDHIPQGQVLAYMAKVVVVDLG